MKILLTLLTSAAMLMGSGVVKVDVGQTYALRVEGPQPKGCARPGRYAGTLWGGNLAMLCSLIGTPYLPDIRDGILFVEDINEHPYRVERMLLQLQQVGVLDAQQALVLGDFSG